MLLNPHTFCPVSSSCRNWFQDSSVQTLSAFSWRLSTCMAGSRHQVEERGTGTLARLEKQAFSHCALPCPSAPSPEFQDLLAAQAPRWRTALPVLAAESKSRSVVSDSLQPHGLYRLYDYCSGEPDQRAWWWEKCWAGRGDAGQATCFEVWCREEGAPGLQLKVLLRDSSETSQLLLKKGKDIFQFRFRETEAGVSTQSWRGSCTPCPPALGGSSVK